VFLLSSIRYFTLMNIAAPNANTMSTPLLPGVECSVSSSSKGDSAVSSPPWSASRAATAITQDSSEDDILEPGEIKSPNIKQEKEDDLLHGSNSNPPNPFLKYQIVSRECKVSRAQLVFRDYLRQCQHLQTSQINPSPFANIADATNTSSIFNPSAQQVPAVNPFANGSRPMTSVQRRNHERLGEIVHRLENFNGSITELLAVAKIQQQMDTAFVDLDRARNQLKEVLHQFELQGHMSSRQGQKKNHATKELSKSCNRLCALFGELKKVQGNSVNAS
jgi:hypothetical protein